MAALTNGDADNLATSWMLMDQFSETERPRVLSKLIKSLNPEDETGISFVASLVVQEPTKVIEMEFLAFLERLVQVGAGQTAVRLCTDFSYFGEKLLAKTIEELSQDKSALQDSSTEEDFMLSYLEFSKSVIPCLPSRNITENLLDVYLSLLRTGTRDIAKHAIDVVFAILTKSEGSLSRQNTIWETIHKMTMSKSKHHALQGYSLWLRYLLTVSANDHKGLMTSEYWQDILHGLRHGDSEQRKLCLNILKLSITADSDVVPTNARQQYERYCTIFETIVLGRYINQIQECEHDLYALAKTKDFEPSWLYVLLASALDSRMQDSNRKCIGNWIMRSNLAPSPDYLEFIRRDFLPWAMQGQLFVSTLKETNGALHCGHGDSLSKFIKRLKIDSPIEVVDMVVDAIHQRSKSVFAYAVVYLLEGVADLLEARHLEKIAEVKALPEVARDYIKCKASKLGLSPPEPKNQSRREVMEQSAIDKCRNFNGDLATLEDIWTDLEYLEFPKRLLIFVPLPFFSPGVIQRAIYDPKIAEMLAEKLERLQTVGTTKVFLFSQLVKAVRVSILINPDATQVLPIADFVLRIIEHPPEPTIDLLLEEAIIPLTPCSYNDYFGDRKSVGFAALLDLLSRLSNHQNIIETILNHVLSTWKAQKVPPPTVSAWKNTLQLQALLLCCEQYEIKTIARTKELLDDLFHVLAIEPLPRYRYLLEATIVRFITRHDLEETIVERLNTKDHHSNPKHLASLMKIGAILACRKESSSDFGMRLATAFVPLAASSKVVIRHEAQWQVPVLMDHARMNTWSSITENPAFVSLDAYIRSLERFSDPPLERRVGTFNPEADHTLSNLAEGRWFDLDEMGSPLTSHDDFIKLYQEDTRDLPLACMPLGGKIHQHAPSQANLSQSTADTKPALGPRTVTEASALQTKGTAYLARTLADPNSHTPRPHDLIVIGSLVDNPYNLGGLSRVSEIFGASALTLQNQNFVSNKDFTSVSVSSHLHLPIVQLSAPGVPAFLAERKQEGFTVVGIEQTDRSVMLGSDDCSLPKKVVLVVGSEKEGIPAVVLTECDLLVEIPQAGVTRSLNVQTAVGIVLFECARQRKRAD